MLKYLFTAYYGDGETFHQDPEDVSKADPKRSAFFDVDHSRLVGFSLQDHQNEFYVDLQQGFFEINNIRFLLHEEEVSNFRLIFFRRHKHHVNIGMNTFEESGHEITYRLGWQANDKDGNNIQRIIEFE